MRYLQIRRSLYSLTGHWPKGSSIERTKAIEQNWIPKLFDEHERYQSDQTNEKNEKMYVLPMFPYPSGRLHMGHVRIYTLSDALARYYRLCGHRVVHCIGWDAFGLPAENAAFERSEEPDQWTNKNIAYMREQIQQLACSFDWKREISTCDPNYYRWTQYIFLMLYREGLVYQKKAAVNWDPVDQTVLADEQIDDSGRSWRSGAIVEKKYLKQWFIRTRAFTQSLYNSLETLDKDDWQTLINIQRMWMGDCNGVNLIFKLSIPTIEIDFIETVTTRPETLLNVTHIYIRSNHPLAKSEFVDETETGAKKLRIDAVHPLTERLLPIYVDDNADFGPKIRANMTMLNTQIGTPLSNQYDESFAIKHKIPTHIDSTSHWHTVNQEVLLRELRSRQLGGYHTSGKLNDWCISRQRYWGTPIPIVHCDNCGVVPVNECDLPIRLPPIKNIRSSSRSGISPLANAHEWIQTSCPKCGKKDAKRETDTMDTFVDSSWYFLRYLDYDNDKKPFEPKIANELMPVDLYIGGLEHALTHLFVARFIQHFMHSKGLCTSLEPFKRFIPIGMVQGKTYKTANGVYVTKDQVLNVNKNSFTHAVTNEPLHVDWEKMSKSKHNGTDPHDIISQYGVDFTRLLMLNFVHPRSLRNFTLEDGIGEGLINWFKTFTHLYVDLIEPRVKTDSKGSTTREDYIATEKALREQRLNTIYTVKFYIDSFFSIASAIIELQKFTRYLRKIPVDVKQHSEEYNRALCDLLVMLGPVIPCLSSELWTIVQNQIKTPFGGYDFKKSLFEQSYPELPEEYPGKINALFEHNVFASIPASRSILPSLSMSEAVDRLLENDTQSQMKIYIEKNGLKLDRLRKLGNYCATLVYERDPNVIIDEPTETKSEKKKTKSMKKKMNS